MSIRIAAISAIGLTVFVAVFAYVVLIYGGGPADDSAVSDQGLDEPPSSIHVVPADGAPNVTKAEALAAAREFALYDAANRATSTTAQYVLFTNDGSHTRGADGSLLYRDLPVWLITYQGVVVPSHGGSPPNSELNIIVDAETGEALRGYSYR